MTLLLAFGFVAVAASGAVFWYRGRLAAGIVATAAVAVGIAVAFTAGGREGFGEFSLGVLIGLPVLVGGAAARERAEKKATHSQAVPTKK